MANLQNEDFEFTGEVGEVLTFYLAFSDQLVSNDILSESQIKLSTDQQDIVISGLNDISSRVMLYDLMGRTIVTQKVCTQQLIIPISKQGVYLVKVIPEQGVVFNGKTIISF